MVKIRDNLPGKAYDILRGDKRYAGTYVDFQVGVNLCQEYGLIELMERLYALKASLVHPVSGVEPSQTARPMATGVRLDPTPAQRSSIDPRNG